MQTVITDGGRKLAGYKGNASDCVVRAIAIATQKPYQDVYNAINTVAKSERKGKRKRGKSSSHGGVYRFTYQRYLESIGWKWTPTMHVGSGCTVHLKPDELPMGRIVVSLSKHLAAVIDRVLHDTSSCSRNGTRCVYGYWKE